MCLFYKSQFYAVHPGQQADIDIQSRAKTAASPVGRRYLSGAAAGSRTPAYCFYSVSIS